MDPSGVATVTTGSIRIPGVADVPDVTNGYVATFSMSSAAVTGWADYVEPGAPLCPGKGSAAGNVSVSAPAAGVVLSADATVVGHVDGVYLSSRFTYDRVGSSAAVVTLGWIRVYFHTDSFSGYFDRLLAGAGAAEFTFNPVQAANDCLSPGRLDYELAGAFAVETSKPYTF